MSPALGLNRAVAERLRQAAELLEDQAANPFRVRAYRQAAETVERLPRDLDEIFAAEGEAGLDALPAIGPSIAAAIAEMLRTGRWAQLERLKGAAAPERLFATVPGIGPKLALTIHDALQVDTLEALELAAHDGRLETVPGIGPRRAAAIRASLAAMLARTRRPRPPLPAVEPEVALLLDIDAEYRRRAAAGDLPRIAPKRFNPIGEAWLPILHAERGPWSFTALYSNTARAHELDKAGDWVVIYFQQGGEAEGQRTVVTETRGPLAGRRVVRGREAECRRHHAAAASVRP
jgi:hypothetical protein